MEFIFSYFSWLKFVSFFNFIDHNTDRNEKRQRFDSMSNFEEPPCKKRNLSLSPLTLLPDDVTLSYLARVSRLDHAALSLTSKSYRSQVASSDLYNTRSLISQTETYLYVCLRTPPNPNPSWFILRHRKTLENAYDLIPIPSLPSQAPEASSVVVHGWGIYVIGGFIEGNHSSDVFFLDCRTHTWRQVPSMRVARANTAAGVVDGKIYVLGGGKFEGDSSFVSFGEVFDPKTQSWDVLPWMPGLEKHDKYIHDSVVSDQKVYAVDGTNRILYYKPRKGLWGRGNRGEKSKGQRDWCMIDNLLYCCTPNGIFWCEAEKLHWRQPEPMVTKEVKGLYSLKKSLSSSRLIHFDQQVMDLWDHDKIKLGNPRELKDLLPGFRMKNLRGNIVLLWDVVQGYRLEIWCAEISLEKRQEGEIWGNIEWSNVVMTVDPFVDHYKVLYSASVTM